MLYQTDKSGKTCLDTKANYLSCMEEHFKDDPISTPEEVRQAELLLNNTARSMSRILNIGKGQNQGRRCTNTLISMYATIPTLQGLMKDHKENIGGDSSRGPKLRPLAATNRAPNAP